MSIKHALVVDDSKSARFSLRKMLQQAGLSVDMVDSGEAALEYLHENRPDVVFMDHMMPGLNGLEATKAIKENPATTMIPVVMSTSKEGDDYMQEVKANGVVSILPKPSTPDVLAQVLENLNALSQVPTSPAQPVAALDVTRDIIESMLSDSVNVAVKAEVQRQLAHMLAVQLAQVKQDLVADYQTVANETSKQSVETTMQKFRQGLLDTVQEQMEEKIAAISQQIADDLYTNRARELENQFNNTLRNQLLKFKAESNEPRPLDSTTREEIGHLAQAVADKQACEAARQTAKVVAEEAASQSAQQVAKQTTESITKTLLNDAMEANRPKLGPTYLLSALAMALSMLAVVAVFY